MTESQLITYNLRKIANAIDGGKIRVVLDGREFSIEHAILNELESYMLFLEAKSNQDADESSEYSGLPKDDKRKSQGLKFLPPGKIAGNYVIYAKFKPNSNEQSGYLIEDEGDNSQTVSESSGYFRTTFDILRASAYSKEDAEAIKNFYEKLDPFVEEITVSRR